MTELEDDARDVRTRITLRDHDQLRRTLARIDEQGWDGPTGRSLLEFIRQDMIRPMIVAMGLRGTAACEAEATGWAAAWEALCNPRLVEAEMPWSLVHAAARHALLGELLAARYASGVHRAWRIRDAVRGSEFDPRVMPVDDLTELLEAREDPADGARGLLDAVLGPIRERLVQLGWSAASVGVVVDAVLDARLTVGPDGACAGWRPLAAELGVGFPGAVAVDEASHTAYVTNVGDGTVSVIDTRSNTVTATITVGDSPGAVAVDEASHTAYVTNVGDGTVSAIDTRSNTVTATITVGTYPLGVAVDPATGTVYVTNRDGTVSVISAR